MNTRHTLVGLALLGTAARPAGAQYRAETFAELPPQEVAAPVRTLLSDQGVRVSGPGGTHCEIWFRKEIPVNAAAPAMLGVAYPGLAVGDLVGVIRFPAAANDFRNRTIQPGVYTLRYGRHPVDGNHMGVAPHRDFLLASPAAEDAIEQARELDPLVALSSKASGTTHPSVWSLMPLEEKPAALPAVVEYPDEGLWVLYAQAGNMPLALVVVGHAPEA